MGNSANLIRKFYRVKVTDRLSKVIAQVDAVAALTTELLDADFVGVFYCKAGGDELIPVAYQERHGDTIQQLDKLERAWSPTEIAAMHPVSEKAELLRFEPAESLDIDVFARANGFNFRYLIPYRLGDNLRGVLVAYWSADPGTIASQTRELTDQFIQILYGSMALADEMTDVENYSFRLSDLITMFEMSIGDLSYREIVGEIIRRFRSVVSHAGICVVTEDKLSGKLKLGEFLDDDPPQPALVNALLQALEKKGEDCSCNSPESSARIQWCDLSSCFVGEFTAVSAARMCPDEEHRLILVVWTRREGGFEQNDRELLPVFGIFADMVLQNALLVKSLRQVNHLLKKSSSRMASIESLAALADMTSGVAHDFNNIIGGIIGRLQLMKLRLKNDAVVSDLEKLESMAMEGAETVRRLQEFATSARQKDYGTVDLCDVIRDVLKSRNRTWQELADRNRIVVDVRFLVDSAPVTGSPEDLATALEKLIVNAVEHSPQDGKVEVVLGGDDSRYTLSVIDNGPGIADDISKKVFYPFFSTKHERGAGLGLAIVHGIVSRHDGKVSFRNGANSGVTFSVSFNRSEKQDETSDFTRRVKVSSRLKILVVDDDEQIREVLRDMLTIDGHSPTTCADGYEALKKLEAGQFDIMITDLGMPGMSGLDLAGVVHEAHPEMPIAMITGWGTQLSKDETALKGIKTVLSKPFHLKDVKALVQDLVAAT